MPKRDDKSERRAGERSRSAGASGAIVTVPAEMAGELRNDLHSVLGEAADGISATTELSGRERHPEWYAEHRNRFERTLVLLDLIGCAPRGAMKPGGQRGPPPVTAMTGRSWGQPGA
jgi:hypothetical protein